MTKAVGYALFDTALGACGIAWSETAIVGVRLPEASAAAARALLSKRYPEGAETAPPAFVRAAMDAVVALLAGEKADLTGAPLDFGDAPDLHRRIYEVVRAIPPGKTLTYGEVARAIGEPHAAQAVGQAMGRNPCPILMPCHRVLGADGKIGGFSAPGGAQTKRQLLEIEGATAIEQLPLFGGG